MRLPLAVITVMSAVPAAVSAQPTQPSITAKPLPPPASQTEAPPQRPPMQPEQPPWVPQGSAQLQVLDKVNAQNTVLTVKVGQAAQFGSLNIEVQACESRPPDQPQDAAAFVTITDSHADAPGFRGWMLAHNPALSMLQHPIYDVRIIGCKA
jgi:hypothetical protein